MQLPVELKNLVNWSVSILGEVLRDEMGKKFYDQIEGIRSEVKKLRPSDLDKSCKVLDKYMSRFQKMDDEKLYQVAHSFSLMLEVINTCEAAYRTFRLKGKQRPEVKSKINRILFVLTAHPTEARSMGTIEIFEKLLEAFVEVLEGDKEDYEQEVKHLLHLAWRLPTSKEQNPTVQDEASYIYKYLLSDKTLDVLAKQEQRNQQVHFRTWVGGDKDGHPGVDAKVMMSSLQLSRKRLIKWILKRLDEAQKDLSILEVPHAHFEGNELKEAISKLKGESKDLNTLRDGDGKRLEAFRKSLIKTIGMYKFSVGGESPKLAAIEKTLRAFPGLVVPLELREDAEFIHLAIKEKNAIYQMLKKIADLAKGTDPQNYVRGFIISMCVSADDINAALKLMKKTHGHLAIPVVPLFENEKALKNGKAILTELFSDKKTATEIKKAWNGRYEVMVGYSDSAKENGSYASKYLIYRSLKTLDSFLKKNGFTPIFFHGSGGSVARGGGSIKEQTSWWPQSAIEHFKATIQGEMIHRNFASPEILQRQIDKITAETAKPHGGTLPKDLQNASANFAAGVQSRYREMIHSEDFLKLVESATPYSYLQHLKIGSRPSKRKKTLNVNNLRAIPWVLCWTQTRTLFPSWWGVGSYWQSLEAKEQKTLQKLFIKSTLFRSYIKLLGFTLAKVELAVFHAYLKQSDLSLSEQKHFYNEFKREFEATKKFFRAVSGEKSLLWHRPWLSRSIELRSPQIHPLNLIQIIALKRGNMKLLRETVTGIASGMLTTG